MAGHPIIAVIAPGAMGAAVAARLTHAGCTVLTNLDGRSSGTVERAKAAGMQHASFSEIVERVDWVLSILPPSDAVGLSTSIYGAHKSSSREKSKKLVYVDCNAVNPETARSIASQWKDVEGVIMLDAGIIGGPPSSPQDQDKKYDPTIYASSQSRDLGTLHDFVKLGEKHNLKVVALEGEGASVGDASALKMSYAGISKGLTGLITTMLLSAHASSPATADALLNELNQSQPMIIKRLTGAVPDMIPKAYRFSGEMEEIAGFVGNGVDPSVGQIYNGIAKLYERVDASLQKGGNGEVDILRKLVEQAKTM